MPFIPAVNTARVVFNQTLHGQQISNTFHVRKNTAWSAPELTALAQEFIEWANTDLAPNQSANVGYSNIQARSMTTPDDLGVEIQFPLLSGGELPGEALPGNVAIAIKHVTGFTGRNRQGRTFLAGAVTEMVAGQTVPDITRNSLNDAFEALRGRLVADDQELVVASYYDGTALVSHPDGTITREPVPRASALLTPVLSFSVDPFTDSQRRRLTGRGT